MKLVSVKVKSVSIALLILTLSTIGMSFLVPALAFEQLSQYEENTFSLAPLKSELSDEIKVGGRRAGILCVPAGAFRWREINLGEDRSATVVARKLNEFDLGVFLPDPDWPERKATSLLRLSGTIKSVSLEACAKEYGAMKLLTKARTLKGEGKVGIDWRVLDSRTRRVVASFQIDAPFRFEQDRVSLREAFELGLAENARLLAPKLADFAATTTVTAASAPDS